MVRCSQALKAKGVVLFLPQQVNSGRRLALHKGVSFHLFFTLMTELLQKIQHLKTLGQLFKNRSQFDSFLPERMIITLFVNILPLCSPQTASAFFRLLVLSVVWTFSPLLPLHVSYMSCNL